MQMRPGELRLCNIQLLICCQDQSAGDRGGAALHIGMLIHQSVRWHVRQKKGELHSADKDISFTKHFLLCTWKHGIIMRKGDAPWNGMGAWIWGSGHSAMSTEMRVILYPEMPVTVEMAPQVQSQQSMVAHDITSWQTSNFCLGRCRRFVVYMYQTTSDKDQGPLAVG